MSIVRERPTDFLMGLMSHLMGQKWHTKVPTAILKSRFLLPCTRPSSFNLRGCAVVYFTCVSSFLVWAPFGFTFFLSRVCVYWFLYGGCDRKILLKNPPNRFFELFLYKSFALSSSRRCVLRVIEALLRDLSVDFIYYKAVDRLGADATDEIFLTFDGVLAITKQDWF